MALYRHIRQHCPGQRELRASGNRYSYVFWIAAYWERRRVCQERARSWKRMGEGSIGTEEESGESLINTESCRHGDETLNYWKKHLAERMLNVNQASVQPCTVILLEYLCRGTIAHLFDTKCASTWSKNILWVLYLQNRITS